jgi:hypothetical protein
MESRALRFWFARFWLALFAFSYSAAALAEHCQAHMPKVQIAHNHDHYDHDRAPVPADGDKGCSAMAWEQMLGPASLGVAKPDASLIKVSRLTFLLNAPGTPQLTADPPPRPPPDTDLHPYSAAFARTGRLLL